MVQDNRSLNTEVYAHIGARVRFFRKRRKMSPIRAALLFGINIQQLQRYETGKSRIPIDRLILIASVLGVDLCALLENIPPVLDGMGQALIVPAKVEFNWLWASIQAQQIAITFDRIENAELRRAIFEFVNSVAPEKSASD